jgi:hypothetical protein
MAYACHDQECSYVSPRDRAAGLRLAVVVSDLHIDRRVLLYALGLSVLTGPAPAISVARG